MEEKKILLLQVIMKLGKFFMTCDGQTDEREVQFINDYTEQLIQQDEATREQLEVIKNRMPEDLSIEYLVDQTKNLLDYATEEERGTLFDQLASFVQNVIMADELLHPKEENFFKIWKEKCK